jgi:hypothetical protein
VEKLADYQKVFELIAWDLVKQNNGMKAGRAIQREIKDKGIL